MQSSETEEVVRRPLGRVLACGPVLDQKSPITRLGEQKLPRHLLKDAIRKRRSIIHVSTRSIGHPSRRQVQTRVDPRVRRIEPHTEMPILAPRGCGRDEHLLSRMRSEKLTRRSQLDRLGGRRCSNEVLEKLWPFKPPVTKQFGIERR